MAHTPGVWFWPHDNALAAGSTDDPDGWTLVAAIHDAGPVSNDDARLIAAAPDMYEAGGDLIDALSTWIMDNPVHPPRIVTDAIANLQRAHRKAEGKAA